MNVRNTACVLTLGLIVNLLTSCTKQTAEVPEAKADGQTTTQPETEVMLLDGSQMIAADVSNVVNVARVFWVKNSNRQQEFYGEPTQVRETEDSVFVDFQRKDAARVKPATQGVKVLKKDLSCSWLPSI